MSDLENANARSQHSPITAFATGRLASIGGRSSQFSQADGLVDAFAEVFASIAASDAHADAPSQLEAPSEGQEVLAEDTSESNDTVVEESDEEQQETQAGSGVESQQVIEQAEVAVEDNDVEQLEQEVVEAELAEDQGNEPQVVAVERSEEVNTTNENARPELLGQEQNLQSELQEDGADRRRYSEAVQPVVQADESLSDAGVIRQTHETPAETNLQSEDSLSSQSEEEIPVAETQSDPRRSRRRRDRHDRAEKRPVESVNSNSGDQAIKSKGASQNNSIADALSRVAGVESTEQSKPAAKVATPTVSSASVQSTAAARADSASGPQAARGARIQRPQGLESIGEENRVRPEAAAKSTKAKPNTRAETVSRVKLIQRVSKAFQHLGADGGVVRLRLAPGDLGTVRVEVKVQNRNVQARVVAETEAASASLRESLPELRTRLESFGLQVEKIEVEVDSGSQQESSFFNHDSGNQQEGSSDPWGRRGQGKTRSSQSEVERVSPSVSLDAAGTAEVASAGVDIRL